MLRVGCGRRVGSPSLCLGTRVLPGLLGDALPPSLPWLSLMKDWAEKQAGRRWEPQGGKQKRRNGWKGLCCTDTNTAAGLILP